jgi:hypothetical protein
MTTVIELGNTERETRLAFDCVDVLGVNSKELSAVIERT